MEIFIRIILIFSAVGLISFLAIKESKTHPFANVIRLPKVYFWVGIACLVFFLTVLIALIIFPDDTLDGQITLIIVVVFLIFPISIITAYLNWKIEISDKYIIYRTFFRKKYEYEFREVWIKKNTPNIIIAVTRKKKLYIDPHAIGIEKFINKVRNNKAN